MNNLKKYNPQKSKWDIITSSDAKGISLSNPKMLKGEEKVISVDTAIERLKDDLSVAQGNISWLALHGGGGSGGGGGVAPSGEELAITFKVNGLADNSEVNLDANGLKIDVEGVSVKYNKNWQVSVLIGSKKVYQISVNASNTTFFIEYPTVAKQLINHTGRLTIQGSYDDDANGIYGKGQWSGSVIDNNISMDCDDVDASINKFNTTYLKLKYSVGVMGEYLLNVRIKNEHNEIQKQYNLSVASTYDTVHSITLSDLFTEDSKWIGVYDVTWTLTNKKNTSISKTIKSSLTVVSNEILIASNDMSKDQNNPTLINMDGSIYLSFTAYVSQYTSYTYNVYIDDTLVRENMIGIFSQKVKDYIAVSNKPFTIQDKVAKLRLVVTAGNKRAEVTYYIKFVKSNVRYLEDTRNMYNYQIFKMQARDFNQGTTEFPYENKLYNLSSQTVTSNMHTVNQNVISAVNVKSTGEFYYRVSNSATAIIDNIKLNQTKYTFNNLVSSIGDSYTICIHYRADYHPDDERTILFSGQCSVADQNLGQITDGISIDVHGLYIDNQKVLELEGNTDNDIAIVCRKQTIDGVDQYIIKVYLDGVVSAIRKFSTRIKLGDNIYIGCRQYVKGGVEHLINKCDVDIYSINIYTVALNEFDIMTKHINNVVATNYLDSAPNFGLIDVYLKKNFCSRDANGQIKSLMYDYNASQYTIDFLLNSNNMLDETKLTNIAKEIGIPIMLVDVSNDSSWTFNQFVKQQSASSSTLSDTSNKVVQYWDPVGISGDDSGTDSSVKTINNATIGLQGTSSLKDSVKNINITLPLDTIFTPKSTWIPEQTYTLKADIVDSSHANNAAIGAFINTELGKKDNPYFPFDKKAISNVYDSEYVKKQQPTATLKHTVEGFPVFLIMKFYTDAQNTISVTPLGIYSFNIGRDAHRNLGFKSVQSIKKHDDDVKVTSFPFYEDGVVINETSDTDKTAWIEIGDTNSLTGFSEVVDSLPENLDTSRGDFWQNDDNILNAKYEVRYPSGKQVTDYPGFKEFVSNIMRLPIEGCYSSDVNGVNTIPMISGSYNLYTVDNSGNYNKTGSVQQIITDPNGISDQMGFNIDSAFKYFIICNYFGLVDNFGKNSTYRSWDAKTFYVDFYDLDTAIGGDNQGKLEIEPDVWVKYITNKATNANAQPGMKYVAETFDRSKGLNRLTVSANTSKLWLSLDTPFTKAKWRDGQEQVKSIYAQYWNDFRSFTEDLAARNQYDTFMNYFIDKYFIKQTERCGSLIFNYDYKLKYMLQFTGDIIQDSKDLTKLHGRKIAHNRSWLKKHVIFLDSLFRWRDTQKHQAAMAFKNNIDVSVNATVDGTQVQALPVTTNCPIISHISVGDTVQAFYFLPNNTKTLVNVGNMQQGGPYTWVISNSNNFIELGDSNVPLFNMKISSIAKSINQFNIDPLGLPAIHTLDLHNNKYFDSQFNLDVFRQADVSEVRSINLSNTECAVSSNSFILDIEQNYGTENATTKFKKLTDIDISGSKCVTNIYIPTQVPLNSLKISNSNIKDLRLINQQYLPELNVDDCNNLQTVYIQNCNNIKTINLSNYANLRSVKIINCNKLESITISNNSNLEKVNIENCVNVSDIRITNNNSLRGNTVDNYVTLSDLGGLLKLNLSQNRGLQKINISKCNEQNIINLYLDSTAITNFNNDNILDLHQYKSIQSFDIRNNTAVSQIQLYNKQDKSIKISVPFTGCSNLSRVFGNIEICSDGIFDGLRKFSIHGSTSTVQFMGHNVIAIADSTHQVQMPSKIIAGSDNPDTWTMPFNEELGNTNITYKSTTDGTEMFRDTACTMFDLYYTLQNIGSLTSIDLMFYGASNIKFQRTKDADNSPNRYMFKFANKLKSINTFFNTLCGNGVVLYSPENDGVNVTKDNGLFSPLVDTLETLDNYWYMSIQAVFDRFLFRHSNKNYKIQAIKSFLDSINNVLIDDTNHLSSSDQFITTLDNKREEGYKTDESKYGNLKDAFKNLPNLTVLYNAFNAVFINYDTIIIDSPVLYNNNAFCSYNGIGTINFHKIFAAKKIQELQGFVVYYKYKDGVQFYLNNDTFKGLTLLNEIIFSGKDCTMFTLGDGVVRTIDGQFPYEIFKNLPELRYAQGIFENVDMPNQISGNFVSLPGSLFENNPQLISAACMFRNVKFDYEMTSDGFKNCPNLQYLNYIFSNANYAEYNNGFIPERLFYHGEHDINLTYYGIQDGTLEVSKEVVNNKNVTTYTITRENGKQFKLTNTEGVLKWYKKEADKWLDVANPEGVVYFKKIVKCKAPNTNILDIRGAFKNNRISPYVNEHPSVVHNENYQPFKFIYKSGIIAEADNYDNIDETIMWSYDGIHQVSGKHDGDFQHDRNTVLNSIGYWQQTQNGSLNHCCAPDLLRYCNGKCNITQLFQYCGPQWHQEQNKGITGRIPAVLLLPLKQFDLDLTEMFSNCSNLQRVSKSNDSSVLYVIPPTFFKNAPNVISLQSTFEYTTLYYGYDFSSFKDISNNKLGNINKVFYSCFYGDTTDTRRTVVNSAFSKFTGLSNISSAFAQNYVNHTNGYVKFSNVFQQNTYTSTSQYGNNDNFKNVFRGYSKDFVQHENPKSLIDNNITNNYTYDK